MLNTVYSEDLGRSFLNRSPSWMVLLLTVGLFALAPGISSAALLPADLNISTSPSPLTNPDAADYLSFDEDDSSAATGNATHTGSLVQTIGGLDTTTTIVDTAITSGTNPLSGTLTDIDDGWEIHSNISGSFSSSSSENPEDIYDLFFSLQNLSATDSLQVTITLDFDNHVDSSGGDAFAASAISFLDGSSTELFFSDIQSDTVFGNQFNSGVHSTTDFGGPLDDNGIFQHVVTLNPGDLLDFHIFHLIEGGAFATGSSYSASMDARVSFDAINLTNPTPAPEPGMLALMGIGLLGFAFRRKMKA